MLAGFIERLLDARTITDIQVVFLDALKRFGFENGLYAAHFMLTVPRSLSREGPVVFSNLPTDLIENLQNLRGLEGDPWIEWVLANDGDIAAHDLVAPGGAQTSSSSLTVAAHHGYGAARIISLRDKVLHSVGAVLVMPGKGADTDALAHLWTRSGREIRVLCWVMHMRMATMHRKPPPASLTPRQREVLGWRSCGKTVGEIATILGITPATVEKHMRLARESLGVETTPQAVLKAHVTHQLFHPALAQLSLAIKR